MDKIILPVKDAGEVSDGYHTFNELYEHRIALFILVLKLLPKKAFKSRFHGDGSSFEGWFVAGLETEFGQITYHLPDDKWDLLDGICWRTFSPEFDGHTSQDVLDRIYSIVSAK